MSIVSGEKKTKALGTTVSFWWAEISPVLSMLMSKKENTGIYFSLKIDCLLRSKVFFTFKPHLCSSFCIKNPMLVARSDYNQTVISQNQMFCQLIKLFFPRRAGGKK